MSQNSGPATAPVPEPALAYAVPPESDDYKWTDRAFDLFSASLLTASAEVSRSTRISRGAITGPCPRCSCPMAWSDVLTAVADGVTGTLSSTGGSGSRWFPLPAACMCTSTQHGGGPAGARGCGAKFTLEVPAQEVK